jgi:hypothetical protein
MHLDYYSIRSTKIVKKTWILVFLVFLSSSFFITDLEAQTTVFTDDLNRATLSPGGSPSLTYTNTLVGTSTADITSNSYLTIANGNTAGISFVAADQSNFSIPFNTTLNSNEGLITWTFNFKFNRTSSPSGLSSGSYGTAIVLAGTSSDLTTGNGYAIAYGQSGTTDPIRLVKYTNGINSSTNIISSGTNDISAVNNYVSVRVTYDPQTDNWSLYLRDDGSSSWTDPSSGVTIQIGSTTTDNEYTSTPLSYFGFVWAHSTTIASTNSSDFDNYTVSVVDSSPPVATWDPADAEIGAPVDGDITITFNEGIFNLGGSIISSDPSSLITFNSSGFTANFDNDKTITISYTGLSHSTVYTVDIDGVEDSNGNATSGESISFTTIGEEPTSDPVIDAPSDITIKDITNTWTDNDGAVPATGFLIMINRTGDFPSLNDPIDGVPQIDDTDLLDDNGVINVINEVGPTGTYTWNNLKSGKNYFFKIYPYNGEGDNINYKADVDDPTTETSATTLDAANKSSIIRKPEIQIAEGTINSITNAEGGVAKDVFRFTVVDTINNTYPDHDTYSTYVTNVRVRPNRTNTVDWSDHIQSVKLYNHRLSNYITTDNISISDTLIDISILKPNLEISDKDSIAITLSVFLKTSSTIDDRGVLSFYIDQDAHGFVADDYGSTFTSDALVADIVSGDFTIEVDASKLLFNSVPGNININTDFTAEVWATDANGNLDINDISNITLTESGVNGTISSASSVLLTENLIGGIYSWTDIRYDYAEGFTLIATDNASSNPLSSGTSTTITAYATGVATPGSILITEFMADPTGTDSDKEWFEIYNSNNFDVILNNWVITDNSESHTIGTKTILKNSFLVLGINSTTTSNGNYNPDYVYSTFVLNNSTADKIILKNGTTEISIVEFDDSTSDWTITEGSSLIFTGTADDVNNDASLWKSSLLHENGYLGTTNTDKGSPGTNGYMQNLVETTTWIGTGNWSEGNLPTSVTDGHYWNNGYPGTPTNVAVNGTLTITTDTLAFSNNLTISNLNSLTISAGNALTIYGNLENNSGSAAGLYLPATSTDVASLITYGTINGEANVESYFIHLDAWHLVSPPISNGSGGIFTDDYVWAWDETEPVALNRWFNITDTEYLLADGVGYAIYKPLGSANLISYSGTLNTGTVTNTLTYTEVSDHDPIDGWNLMGNPYPSIMDMSYLDYTDISNGIWVWIYNDAGVDKYEYWSKTLGTVGSSGEGGGDDRARFIQPGQGFWLYTEEPTGVEISFSNEMRTHQNQASFLKSENTNSFTKDEILKITISGNDLSDPTYILFRQETDLGYDREYDLYKMTSSHPKVPHIFSLTEVENPQKLAINAISQPQSETVVPLGLKIGTDGTYRLYFDGINSFEEGQDFYIRDLLNGDIFDIRLQSMLEFTHSTTDPEHRFDLVMGLQTDINNPIGISLPAEVYSFRNTLYIRPGENQEIIQVEVKNLLGQTVYSSQYRDTFKTGVQLNLPTAFYLVNIQLETGDFSKKIFIQNLN